VAEMQDGVSDIVRIGVSPHTVYTASSGLLKTTAELAAERGLPLMIHVAETIANGLDFARIDLYSDGKSNIKFGEITFTPGNAASRFSDFGFDRWLGTLFGKGPHEPFRWN
jgi:hypothetical protein